MVISNLKIGTSYFFYPLSGICERKYTLPLNDELVKEELKELAPRSVISFKGSKIRMLATHSTEIGYNLYAVNDPSWLLRGAKGIKAWETEEYDSLDHSVKELVDEYAEKLSGRYLAKKEFVKWYLAHYYNEWKV